MLDCSSKVLWKWGYFPSPSVEDVSPMMGCRPDAEIEGGEERMDPTVVSSSVLLVVEFVGIIEAAADPAIEIDVEHGDDEVDGDAKQLGDDGGRGKDLVGRFVL